jgi:hypothetical protein
MRKLAGLTLLLCLGCSFPLSPNAEGMLEVDRRQERLDQNTDLLRRSAIELGKEVREMRSIVGLSAEALRALHAKLLGFATKVEEHRKEQLEVNQLRERLERRTRARP